MAWRLWGLAFFMVIPYLLGMELVKHEWWTGMIVSAVNIPLWVQGLIAIWFGLLILGVALLVVLFTFWASGRLSEPTT